MRDVDSNGVVGEHDDGDGDVEHGDDKHDGSLYSLARRLQLWPSKNFGLLCWAYADESDVDDNDGV